MYKEAKNTSGIFIHSLRVISALTYQSHIWIMESVPYSAMSSGEDERLSDPGIQADYFFITQKDTNILKVYVEEFRAADTQSRKKLLGRLMGELFALRPENAVFDKKGAITVRIPIQS